MPVFILLLDKNISHTRSYLHIYLLPETLTSFLPELFRSVGGLCSSEEGFFKDTFFSTYTVIKT